MAANALSATIADAAVAGIMAARRTATCPLPMRPAVRSTRSSGVIVAVNGPCAPAAIEVRGV